MSQAIDLSIWPEKFCSSVPNAWLRHTSKFHHHASSERKILGICTCCAWLFYSTLLPWEFLYAKLRHFTMGHFRVPPGLCFKTRVGGTRPLIWKSFFILMRIELIFIRKVVHLASFWNEAWWWNLLVWRKHVQGPLSYGVLPVSHCNKAK